MKNKIRKNLSSKIFDVFNYCILTMFMLATLYPVIYVFSISISSKIAVLKNEVFLLPKGLDLDAYRKIFEQPLFIRSYLNTIIYVLLSVAASIIVSIMTAYPLSKQKLKGGSFIMLAITFTMLFGGGLIPFYLLIRNLGMIDTVWVMFVPGAFSAYFIIIARTFFKGLPAGVEESAAIEGANDMLILFKIVIPLSKPIVATIGLFTAVSSWNGYMSALIFLNTQEKFPLQLILRAITITNEFAQLGKVDIGGDAVISTSLKYAAIIVAIIPMLIIYPFIQKYFVKGVMIGSLKG